MFLKIIKPKKAVKTNPQLNIYHAYTQNTQNNLTLTTVTIWVGVGAQGRRGSRGCQYPKRAKCTSPHHTVCCPSGGPLTISLCYLSEKGKKHMQSY